eukprot:scaffold2739_cov257-Pinguiococcus_pyrenoidosus.AAC.18
MSTFSPWLVILCRSLCSKMILPLHDTRGCCITRSVLPGPPSSAGTYSPVSTRFLAPEIRNGWLHNFRSCMKTFIRLGWSAVFNPRLRNFLLRSRIAR